MEDLFTVSPLRSLVECIKKKKKKSPNAGNDCVSCVKQGRGLSPNWCGEKTESACKG